MTHNHFRAPVERDSRVALCDRKWCSFNTLDWHEVTCPECLELRPDWDRAEAEKVAKAERLRAWQERGGA